jgi:hypothetical protein
MRRKWDATWAREELLVWEVNVKMVVAFVEESMLLLMLVLEKEKTKMMTIIGLLELLSLWRKKDKQSMKREKWGGADGGIGG